MTVVLDASTLVKAVLDEQTPAAEAAQQVFPWLAEQRGLRAPGILAWEVGNVVHRKYPAKFGRTAEERADFLAALLAPIDLEPSDGGSLRRAGPLAEENALTFYDAAYLELAARDAKTWLVTDDGRLLRAAKAVLGKERALDALEVRRRMG